MSSKRPIDDLHSPTSTSSKRSKGKGGFSIKDRSVFEARFGKLINFPKSVYKFFSPDEPQAAGPLPEAARDERVCEALLQLVSRAVTPFTFIICSGTRERPLYLFFAFLLAAFRHGSIIISPEGLDLDEEEDVGEDPEETSGDGSQPQADLLAAPTRLLLGFEEDVPGDSAQGPVELVVIKADRETPRETALSEGLRNGLEAGCVAVGAIEVKANVVFSINIWQALGEGIELARWNHKNKVSAPVRIILTDTKTWYFFSLAVKDSNARPFNGRVFKLQKRDCNKEVQKRDCDEEAAKLQKGDCDEEAAKLQKRDCDEEAAKLQERDCDEEAAKLQKLDCDEEAAKLQKRDCDEEAAKLQERDCDEEAAELQKRDCDEEAARPGDEEDKEEAEEFYLFDCIKRYADVLDPNARGPDITEAMYLFYTTLYPDEDISQLPTRIQQGDAKAKEDADAWVRKMLESSRAIKAEMAAAKAAEAEAERRRRMAAEKKAAKAEEKAAEAQEKAAEAQEKAAEAEAKAAEAEAKAAEERQERMALAAELAQLREQLAGSARS
ncbi:hypothetical protein GPECTOR_749g916 [Gonium pectorale]|uniref:Uncharacterized protein n=1 Tax=Gonium pectorale TaxID=33097 RepID=A0A150FU54_GONPE|nr:hypothetical protein GPECTOR_749g916 [Gonium pectorale]|eukprot:KXZ41126.1 hypothetical protein GPECTOR_749g916 [Gonium pectorale]